MRNYESFSGVKSVSFIRISQQKWNNSNNRNKLIFHPKNQAFYYTINNTFTRKEQKIDKTKLL